MRNSWVLCILLLLVAPSLLAQTKRRAVFKRGASGEARWTEERANNWYAKHKWISGANYIPATAINQLEMWQAETFDPYTIEKELGWAKKIGFNTMRVFLHSVAWNADPIGFKRRIDTYLSISEKLGIKTMFVIFDDVWNGDPKPGKQPSPKPGKHNSGWMQDPGQKQSSDSTHFITLEKYVKDVIGSFKNDERILMWDLYNEPGNSGKSESSLPLLKNVFKWARSVNPIQPLTVGLWSWKEEQLNTFQLLNSDVITYHNYEDTHWHERVIKILKASGRPLICTEYMARTKNSRFSNIMPLLKRENVGAINWGFVEGKTNTIYEWDKPIEDGSQPDEWFHDIFFRNGKPYREDEINLIFKLNAK